MAVAASFVSIKVDATFSLISNQIININQNQMKTIRKKIFINCMQLLFATTVCMTGCRKDRKAEPQGDPVVESYSPQMGGGNQEITISGNFFGNAASNVKVWINDVPAEVLSVSQTRIYVKVPSAAGNGTVKVNVGGKEFVLANQFTYTYKQNVYTYSGSGAAVTVDGPLKQASFTRPYWLTYDKKDNAIFVLEEGRRIRRIRNGMVETVATLTGAINNPRSITMSLTADTIFIGNDNAANNNNVTVAILTRDTDFKVQQNYVPSTNETRYVNFAGIHPKDGTLMFYCYPRKLYKWNKSTNRAELLFDLATVSGITADFYANFCFSPDGTNMFVVVKYPFIGILKGTYNISSKTITGGFQRFAGTGNWGAANGQGLSASFDQPAQSVMDADGNMYVAEKFNHWIRKVTPAGEVSTLAGDGGAGNQGFLDGAVTSAKFNEPEGIAIDKDGNMYVADLRNSRIRVIKKE